MKKWGKYISFIWRYLNLNLLQLTCVFIEEIHKCDVDVWKDENLYIDHINKNMHIIFLLFYNNILSRDPVACLQKSSIVLEYFLSMSFVTGMILRRGEKYQTFVSFPSQVFSLNKYILFSLMCFVTFFCCVLILYRREITNICNFPFRIYFHVRYFQIVSISHILHKS